MCIKRAITMNSIPTVLRNNNLFCRLLKRTKTTKKKFPSTIEETQLPVFEYPKGKGSDRRVYVWGLAETGACGIQLPENSSSKSKWNNLRNIRFPSRLPFAEHLDVTNIASGYGFTVLAAKSKDKYKVFGTGLNTDSQIGYHAPRMGHPLELLLRPAPISLPLKHFESTNVIGLSAGRAHLLILTDNEGVFTLGNNSYGQCGRKINPNEEYKGNTVVHRIKSLGQEKIIDVKCGQDHSIFLTESGKVFSCGWGADGQTGLGHYDVSWQPALVKGDVTSERVTKIACTGDCVLALNDKGEVFAWGNTEYGQIPVQNNVQQLNVSYALNFQGLGKIVDIAAGGSFCLIVNDQGDAFVWGYGLLGLGPQVAHTAKPTLIPAPLFGKNDFNPNCKVEQVSCGISHLAAITDNGDLYTWGRNRHGCLGLGHTKDQAFPMKASVGAHVLKVDCGVDHTVAFCKPFI